MARKRSLPASYRVAKPLPYELEQQVRVFFGERLYTIALNFLLNIVASGAPSWTPAHTPSPSYLAIAATCLVHPRTTTRALSSGEKGAASVALDLLRTTNESIGPVRAKLGAAFSFSNFEPDCVELNPMNVALAQAGSLWARAEGFWHVVGWAFNCSVLHPERWKWWRLWLEFMCEVLEDDWNEWVRLADEDEDSGGEILRRSIIFGYIDSGDAAGFGGVRRILRAVFADASSKSVNEFGQVFSKELELLDPDDASPKNTKKRASDVNDQYGNDPSTDEGENSDKKPSPPSHRPKRPRRSTKATPKPIPLPTLSEPALHPDTSYLGGLPSLTLRARLLSLLANVSDHLPKAFLPNNELYRLFIENIRHLSLRDFEALLSSTTLDSFTPAQQSTLCECLLHSMRETSAPKIDPDDEHQAKLERHFLPYPANTTDVVANAKVSVTLAALLVVLGKRGLLRVSEGLRDAVERGVMARETKALGKGRRKSLGSVDGGELGGLEELERGWLRESAEFLRFLVGVV